MRLDLNDDEAHALRELLTDYLPGLRLEVARTEVRDFRHELIKRQEVCERVLELLKEAGV